MLRQYLCQIIFSDGGTYANFILSHKSKCLVLRQDFNNHSFWVGHLNEKFLKEKKYLLHFHNKYKVKLYIFNKACSSVVEHTAHNGFAVGSNPTKLNTLFYQPESKSLMSALYSTTELFIINL